MFKILDGRDNFYQWDLDRQLIVNDNTINQVHFCNKTDDCSLVCEVYEEDGLRVVDVPNVLLQTDWRINVYGYDSFFTKHSACFNVVKRTKPADYVYTETECHTVESAVERALEEAERLGKLDSNAVYVKIIEDENGNKVADYTYDEIVEMYENGKAVYVVSNAMICSLQTIVDELCRFCSMGEINKYIYNIYKDGRVELKSILDKIDETYNPNSNAAQSGKAVATAVNTAYQKAMGALDSRICVFEFDILDDITTENGYAVYASADSYTYQDFRDMADSYCFIYGVFYDGVLEHAHPLILDRAELSFGKTFYPIIIDDNEYWTDERSESNMLWHHENKLNNINAWQNQTDADILELQDEMVELQAKQGYKLLAQTTLTEDAIQIEWTQTKNGEPLSNYKDFFILWCGRFTSTVNSEAFICRANKGKYYFVYHFLKKEANRNLGGWVHIEEIFKNNSGSIGVFKSTFPKAFLENFQTQNNFQTQGLHGNNKELMSDLSIANGNYAPITDISFGGITNVATSYFTAGTKAILFGRAR